MASNKVDRISNLPDDLITQILSRLPVKTLLSTQLLSKRWRYAWTSVPNLEFSQGESNSRDYDEVLEFWQGESNSRDYDEVHLINIALKLHPGPLKKLSLHRIVCEKIEPGRRTAYGYYKPSPDIHSWVQRAVSLKIEVLVLDVHYTQSYSLPPNLFMCDTLKEFRLSAPRFDLGSSVFWKSLKKLTLQYVNSLYSDKIHKIINGSPVLQSLKLMYCSGFSQIIVPSDSKLRNLVIHSCCQNPCEKGYYELLEISGPSITSLEISGYMGCKEYKLNDVSSLLQVSLKFRMKGYLSCKPGSMMMHLLRQISHVEKLSLGSWCTQVLSMCELENLPTKYLNCKILEFDSSIYEESVPGIDRLLRSSPYLERLTIYMKPANNYFGDVVIDFGKFPNIDGENYWRSPEKAAIENSWQHLKVVKFVGFNIIEGTFMLELAKYVLDNAKVLEKLVLNPGKGAYGQYHLMQELLSYPKCSRQARVLRL